MLPYTEYKRKINEMDPDSHDYFKEILKLADTYDFKINAEEDMLKKEIFSRSTLTSIYNGFTDPFPVKSL